MSGDSSASRRIDPEGARRDYLFARLALERGIASAGSLRPVYAAMDEDATGRLGGRLLAAGVVDRASKEELDREVNRAMSVPIDDLDVRGIDRVFRRTVRSKGAIEADELSRIVSAQKKASDRRPLWELLPESGAMEGPLARILEARCRARYFRRRLVELLGGAGALRSGSDLEPGKVVGKYRLVERLGDGRFGPLFRAHPMAGDSDVALRILRSADELVARLSRSRELLESIAGLRHPNIVSIEEIAYEKDRIYVATSLIEGEALDRWCLASEPPIDTKIAVVRDVARALDFAHRRGVLHRDLRPSNLIVSPDGKVHVADFGLYRILGLEEDSETLPYRAPEELGAHGGQASDRSDVYSLGIVLYELLTGLVPIEGENERRLTRKIVQAETVDPGRHLERVEAQLAGIVARAIAPRPEVRTESASAMAHELSRYLSPGSRMDLGPRAAESRLPARRRGPVAWIASGALAVGAGVAAALLWPAGEAADPPAVGPGTPSDAAPPDALGALQRGRIAYDRGEYAEALAALEAGARLDPTRGEIHLERGRALVALDRLAEARLAFEEAVRTAPELDEPRLRLAERLHEDGEWASAIVHLDEFLKRRPMSGPGFLLRGKAALASGREDQALTDFRQASRLVPQDAEGHLFAAVLSARRGDLAGFEEYRRRLDPLIERKAVQAVDLAPTARAMRDPVYAHLARGVFFLQCHRREEAVGAFQEAVRIAPGDETVHFLLGTAHLEAREAREGVEAIYRSVVYALRARKSSLAWNFQAAMRTPLTALGSGLIDPDRVNQALGEDDCAMFAKALYLFEAGALKLAKTAFDRCVEAFPDTWLRSRVEEYRVQIRIREREG